MGIPPEILMVWALDAHEDNTDGAEAIGSPALSLAPSQGKTDIAIYTHKMNSRNILGLEDLTTWYGFDVVIQPVLTCRRHLQMYGCN